MTKAGRSLAAVVAMCVAMLAPVAGAAGTTDDIAVEVEKAGNAIRVKVDCPVAAPRAVAWDVLTDYDHMARFVTNLSASTIRLRFGDRLQVHQKGKVERGPLSFTFENVRDIELSPMTEIRSKMISGDTMPAAFTTRIEGTDGRLRIVHEGSYTPTQWIPPLLGPALIEMETRKQYGEIRDEILRRARGLASR
ncbi:MAG: SRPBCC family protein [Burkholderiales bacterium]